ncbi:unnamed protein product [Rotaria sp. Silwood1]|nr:unnamed protein product [Rotaria sp. Silwood1]CAF1182224.1 unnamed protein product [Rotaria sp. Silwood1]
MFEVLFAVRKDKFKTDPAIQLSLDLIDKNEQHTHMITLDDPCECATMLDVFQYDEQCEENEAKYKEIRKTSLHENSNNEDESSSASSNNDEEEQQFNHLRKVLIDLSISVSQDKIIFRITPSFTNEGTKSDTIHHL